MNHVSITKEAFTRQYGLRTNGTGKVFESPTWRSRSK